MPKTQQYIEILNFRLGEQVRKNYIKWKVVLLYLQFTLKTMLLMGMILCFYKIELLDWNSLLRNLKLLLSVSY